VALLDEVAKLCVAPVSEVLHRVAVPTDYAFSWRQMNLDRFTVQSMLRTRPKGGLSLVQKMIDDIFTPRLPVPSGRFSNGFATFYGALEPETAEAEVTYWVNKLWSSSSTASDHKVWYARIEVNVLGRAKDIRPLARNYPELVHDSDYSSCQQVGKLVFGEGLDCLFAVSVRLPRGTNVPTFQAASLKPVRLGREIGWQKNSRGVYETI